MTPRSAKHVFISFKTEEKDHALVFEKALEEVGYNVWWQEDLQCGHKWNNDIDKALNEAGAIIVLWSELSHDSQWVRHEASQAMGMNKYAPVRIDEFNIDNPYNQIQATDINNWNGDVDHPGFKNLLKRLEELIPPPTTAWQRTQKFVWQQKAVIVLSFIAAIALSLLLRQGLVLNKQIEKQEQTFTNVQKQSNRLDSLGKDLKSQIEVQKELSNNGKAQSGMLNTQLEQQTQIYSNVIDQSEKSKGIISKITNLTVGMDNTNQAIQNNLKIQQQSLSLLTATSEDLKAMKFPVAKGLKFSFKVKIYVDGIKKIWDEKKGETYQILNGDDRTISIIQSNINRPDIANKYLRQYSQFFYDLSWGVVLKAVLNYKLSDKTNTIIYSENFDISGGTANAKNDIYYNNKEECIELIYSISSGPLKVNTDNIVNLNSLFDSTNIILTLKFRAKDVYQFPLENSTETVKIKKIVVSEFLQFAYGDDFLNIVKPGNRVKEMSKNEAFKINGVAEEIEDSELWRYCFLQIPLVRN